MVFPYRHFRALLQSSYATLRPFYLKRTRRDLPAVVKLLEVHRAGSPHRCLELGKEADHQARASATSGFNSLTWMRLATGINLTFAAMDL
jgi:hypothetical protein